MDNFTGQIAVITGASSGIGKAIALGLADRGANLCLVGRDLDRLQAVAATAQCHGRSIRSYQVDLSLDKNVKNLAGLIEDDFGRIDVLVHSAGLISLGKVESSPIAEFDKQYRTNVRAAYLLTQTLLPFLKRNRGQIVFINSSAGLISAPELGQYAATKHALKAVTDSLRGEVNPLGIRVTSVYPGRTATPMQRGVHEIEGKTYQPERLLQSEDVANVVIHALSLPRTAEITDIILRPMLKP